MNLPSSLDSYDLVHAANLICRLPEPKKFLNRLPDLVKKGGYLSQLHLLGSKKPYLSKQMDWIW